MEDNLKRPFVSSAWVSTKEEGSCNFCTERSYSKVLRIRSNHPMRNLSVRICKDCLFELKKVAFTSEERKMDKKKVTVEMSKHEPEGDCSRGCNHRLDTSSQNECA